MRFCAPLEAMVKKLCRFSLTQKPFENTPRFDNKHHKLLLLFFCSNIFLEIKTYFFQHGFCTFLAYTTMSMRYIFICRYLIAVADFGFVPT
jgi:hypothetical protein